MTKILISLCCHGRPGIWLGVLLFAVTLSTQAEQFFWGEQNQRVPYSYTIPSWQLNNLRTTSQGQTVYIKEGSLTRQYELEADAESTATTDDIPAKARFHLAMDVFSPARDMGGQKKGRYYVQGLWELEGADDPQQSAEGALTGKIRGRVRAELTFDPTTENRNWKGIVQIPMSRVRSDGGKPGVRPLRGGGELALAADDGGTLALDLKLWPKF